MATREAPPQPAQSSGIEQRSSTKSAYDE
ncbi:uncharacterized protein METZ01_LOCUS282165 [marine metagenome]|uniref:Uncharacterized protein n=1 Tax=marine metagenome TaxID=408172 RepID=A0A382L361_9ZZZZ